MTEKTLTTENIKPALDALRGELAPWPVVATKQDRLNTAQLNAANSGITSSLVAQIIANTAAIRALESAITGTGLRALVVASLPAVGTTGILYIVPVTTYDPETDADVVNYSNEYIWIPVEGGTASEGHYEQVGQTGIVINNGQLTITVNGTSVGTFTANQSGDTTAAITVPTKADYVDKTTAQSIAGVKTFSDGIVGNVTGNVTGDLTGTASRAIADADGNTISSTYGKLAGANTWTGGNTFSKDNLGVQTAYALGTLPQTEDAQALLTGFTTDSNFVTGMYFYQSTTRGTGLRLTIRNKWDNSGYSTTGTTRNAHFEFLQGAGKTAYLQWEGYVNNGLYPLTNSTYTLGTSSYRWSSVYADSYYYGTTAWGLDKVNEWSNTNRFTSNIAVKNADIEKGVIPSANRWRIIYFTDKNNTDLGTITARTNTTGESYIALRAENLYKDGAMDSTGSVAYSALYIGLTSAGLSYCVPRANVYPEYSNYYDLGTSTNKWKTLNGINPGALSLPDKDRSFAIDTTNWTMNNPVLANVVYINNSNQAPCDGWLYVNIKDAVNGSAFLYNVTKDYGVTLASNGSQNGLPGRCAGFLPVLKGDVMRVYLNTTNLTDIKFMPCMGAII